MKRGRQDQEGEPSSLFEGSQADLRIRHSQGGYPAVPGLGEQVADRGRAGSAMPEEGPLRLPALF